MVLSVSILKHFRVVLFVISHYTEEMSLVTVIMELIDITCLYMGIYEFTKLVKRMIFSKLFSPLLLIYM